jgi:hypothetical protein
VPYPGCCGEQRERCGGNARFATAKSIDGETQRSNQRRDEQNADRCGASARVTVERGETWR